MVFGAPNRKFTRARYEGTQVGLSRINPDHPGLFKANHLNCYFCNWDRYVCTACKSDIGQVLRSKQNKAKAASKNNPIKDDILNNYNDAPTSEPLKVNQACDTFISAHFDHWMSNPFVAGIVDILGIVIYINIARVVLG